MSNELYHKAAARSSGKNYKYVKREWKNGRWNYTYPGENKSSSNNGKWPSNWYDIGKQNAENQKAKEASVKPIRRNSNKLFDSETTIRVGDSVTKYHNVGKISQAIEERKKDWSEAKARVKSGVNEKNTHKVTDTNNLFSKTTGSITRNGNTTYAKERGKLERAVDVGIEYLKDRLGFDELERLGEATKDKRSKQEALDRYMEYVDKEYDRSTYIDTDNGNYERKYKSEGYEDHMKEINNKALKKAKESNRADEKWQKANNDFYNTPLGKLQNIDDNADRARTWLANALSKTAERNAERVRKKNRRTGVLDNQYWY